MRVPDVAVRLAQAFWPGPLTMILPRSGRIPAAVSAGLPTVAVRMPAHPVARALIKGGGPPSGGPLRQSVRKSQSHHRRPCDDGYGGADRRRGGRRALRCRRGIHGGGSDACGDGWPDPSAAPRGRYGADAGKNRGEVEVDPAVTDRLAAGAVAASPGMKYKHYAPKAGVVIVRGDPSRYAVYVNGQARAASGQKVFALCFEEDRPRLQVPVWFMEGGRIPPPRRGGCSTPCAAWMRRGADGLMPPARDRAVWGWRCTTGLLRAAAFTLVDA